MRLSTVTGIHTHRYHRLRGGRLWGYRGQVEASVPFHVHVKLYECWQACCVCQSGISWRCHGDHTFHPCQWHRGAFFRFTQCSCGVWLFQTIVFFNDVCRVQKVNFLWVLRWQRQIKRVTFRRIALNYRVFGRRFFVVRNRLAVKRRSQPQEIPCVKGSKQSRELKIIKRPPRGYNMVPSVMCVAIPTLHT